jgi:pantoate--beta-alanine ligase
MGVQTVRQLDPLRNALANLRSEGPLALVPTMGALHHGHLALVRAARAAAKHVAVSIFVNPRQFGPNEDLAKYPRQFERDCELLTSEGVSLVWAPAFEVMYPQGYATTVAVSGVSEGLCGGVRPGHFDGVATVVAKLFNQVQPDLAFFGEKDWQQLAVIRRMAHDLDLTAPCAAAIHAVPTVREADGLAMSSRNAYLSPQDRAAAAALPRLMRQAIADVLAGHAPDRVMAAMQAGLLSAGFAAIDYAELRHAETLAPVTTLPEGPIRLLVAARIGGARLIDNMPVG